MGFFVQQVNLGEIFWMTRRLKMKLEQVNGFLKGGSAACGPIMNQECISKIDEGKWVVGMGRWWKLECFTKQGYGFLDISQSLRVLETSPECNA